MAKEVWKEYYPTEWHDDQSMDVLFSHFRQNREINPQSWDKKLLFWSNMVKEELMYTKRVSFDAKTLPYAFIRRGSVPKCLPTVLQEMIRSGLLLSRQQFETTTHQGWVSWGFDIFVKRPVSWSFGKVFGAKTSIEGEYVALDLVKASAEAVLQCFLRSDNAGSGVIEVGDLLRCCNDLCADMDTLNLIIHQLVKERKATVVVTDKNERVISFVANNEKKASPVSEAQLQVLKLRKTEEYLREQVLQLSDEMERCKNDARFYLKKGLRNSAKIALRRKQSYGRMLNSREVAQETIHGMIQQIQDAESHKKILDAYSAGASAYRELATKYNLTTDNIDEVISNVQEVFDMQSEINESMAYNPADSTLNVTTDDLEEELSELLADSRQPTSDSRGLVSDFPGNRLVSPGMGLKNVPSPDTVLPNVPNEPLIGGFRSPQKYSDSTQYSYSSSVPSSVQDQTDAYFSGHNRPFTLDESSSLSQISGASSSVDSYGFSSSTSDSELSKQLEALTVIEELNLPAVPEFDPSTPPRDVSQGAHTQQSFSSKDSKTYKSKMRQLAS